MLMAAALGARRRRGGLPTYNSHDDTDTCTHESSWDSLWGHELPSRRRRPVGNSACVRVHQEKHERGVAMVAQCGLASAQCALANPAVPHAHQGDGSTAYSSHAPLRRLGTHLPTPAI